MRDRQFPMQATMLQALASFRLSKPDAVVGCTKFELCAEFLKQAAIDPDFYVQVYTPKWELGGSQVRTRPIGNGASVETFSQVESFGLPAKLPCQLAFAPYVCGCGQAIMFTICVTDSRFRALPRMQTAYVMGVTPWTELDNQPDDIQNWSPKFFDEQCCPPSSS